MCRDLTTRSISDRTTISWSEGIRTDVGIGASRGAGAVVGEAREFATVDQLEVVLDGALARRGVSSEPGLVSVRAARDSLNVRVSLAGVGLGASSGGVDLRLPG